MARYTAIALSISLHLSFVAGVVVKNNQLQQEASNRRDSISSQVKNNKLFKCGLEGNCPSDPAWEDYKKSVWY